MLVERKCVNEEEALLVQHLEWQCTLFGDCSPRGGEGGARVSAVGLPHTPSDGWTYRDVVGIDVVGVRR